MLKHSHYIPKQVYHQCLNSQSHGKIEYICLIPIVKMWAPLPYFLDVRIGVTWITYARSNWHVIRAFIREATPKNDKINYLMPTWAKAYLFCKLEIWPYYFIRFSSEPLPKTWVFFFSKMYIMSATLKVERPNWDIFGNLPFDWVFTLYTQSLPNCLAKSCTTVIFSGGEKPHPIWMC